MAVLFGDSELEKGEVVLKVLTTGEQLQVGIDGVVAKILGILG